LKRSRPALILLGAVLAGATFISLPVTLDVPVVGVAPGSQDQPRVAASNSQFLAVWRDTRDGTQRIWGARLSGGEAFVFSPNGFPVSFDNGTAPVVASDGQGWLAVWQRDLGMGSSGLWAVQVDSSGALSTPFPVCPGAGSQQSPQVAFDGTRYQVTWLGNPGVVITQVERDGGTPTPCGVPVIAAPSWRIAAGPAGTFIEWSNVLTDGGAAIAAGRVSALAFDGGGSAPVAEGALGNLGGVYPGANNLLWTWAAAGPVGTGTNLFGRRMNYDGGWLDVAPVLLANHPFIDAVAGSGIDGGWTLYFDDWPAQQSVSSVFLDSNLVAGQLQQIGFLGYVNSVDVAVGNGTAVVWPQYPFTGTSRQDIRVMSTNVFGAPQESNAGRQLVTAGNAQTSPAVAASGSGWMVVWEDSRGTTLPTVWGLSVGPDGTPVGAAFNIGPSLSERPSIASDGTGYLVTYEIFPAVWAVKVPVAGAVGAPFLIAAKGSSANVFFDGQQYAVTWYDSIAQGVHGLRLGLDDAGLPLVSITNLPTGRIQVAPLGGALLAAWADDTFGDVYAGIGGFDAGVAGTGTHLFQLGGVFMPLNLHLAALDDRWLLAWDRPRQGPTVSEGLPGAAWIFLDGGLQVLPLDNMTDAGVGGVLPIAQPPRLIYSATAPTALPAYQLSLVEVGVADSGQAFGPIPNVAGELPAAAARLLDGGSWLLVESVFDSSIETVRLRARLLTACAGNCSVDAGSDAGLPPDAGSAPDAGSTQDGGSFLDGGGTEPDGGRGSPGNDSIACGCSSGAVRAGFLAALCFTAIRRRRRS
jgi:hypothetical protein